MQSTTYHDLNAVLRELLNAQRAVFADRLVGVYLQGSFAVGDFDLHSDVDWIAVVEGELVVGEVDALQAAHGRLHDLPVRWAKHLEGSYFPREVLRDPARTGEDLWYLDNGSRALIRSDHCNTLLVRWVVRERGIALAGPAPATLLEPVGAAALRREVLGTLNGWGREILDDPERWANRFFQGFIVLSFCRMLNDLVEGAAGSKLAGAEWAIRNLDPAWAGLIDRAWARRTNAANWIGLPADPADWEATLDFVRHAMERSRRWAEREGLAPSSG